MARPYDKRLLVIGASRGIGLQVVERALAEGYSVRAFARGAAGIGLSHSRLETWPGDALSRADIDVALEGASAVIQALGVTPNLERTFRPVTLFSEATRVLLPAMAKAEVKRLVSITGFGAGDSGPRMRRIERLPFQFFLGRAYADKSMQERLIRNSDRDWTIVRPVVLTNGPRTGRYEVLTDPVNWRNGFISRADVADFVVRTLDDPATVGEAPVILHAPLPF